MGKFLISHATDDILDEMFQERGVQMTDWLEEPREQKGSRGHIRGLLGEKNTMTPKFRPEEGRSGI